jgi:hypothetical protein
MTKLKALTLIVLIIPLLIASLWGSTSSADLNIITPVNAQQPASKSEVPVVEACPRPSMPAGQSQMCDDCKQVVVDPPAETPPPASPTVRSKWDLWTNGTLLRGVNIWQKAIYSRDKLNSEGKLEVSFETSYSQSDFSKMRLWGANYVNISHAGIYSEKPIETERGKPKSYIPVDGVITNLKQLITMSRNTNLFVVVSFRTGPGRNEAVFDEKEKGPITTAWKTDGRGALTKEACEAQNAWVEMWRRAAHELKDFPNVVGYDLMVEPHQEREKQKDINKQELWFALAEKLAEAIRREDTRTPIIIGGANVSTACTLSCIDPGRFKKYERVIYAAHQYDPYDLYTHQANKYAGYKCDKYGSPVIKKPERGQDHAPHEFDDAVKTVMCDRYRYIYGFRSTHDMVPVAVNEYGIVRYAGAEGKPDAYKAIEFEMNLNERIGANHALWLWEPPTCIGYDELNIKHGPDPLKHLDLLGNDELQDDLINAIKRNWERNRIFATPDVLDRLGAEDAPRVPLPDRQVPLCQKPTR